MAHFAKLDENNLVLEVHVVNDNCLDLSNEEESGIIFLGKLFNYFNWKQTSYNGKIRKNYAGIGFTYDPVRDAFIPPMPDNAIQLDENTCQWIVSDNVSS